MNRIERLIFGQTSFQMLDTPVFVYGSNESQKPKIAITSCVHGDEPAGLFLIDKIKRVLESLDSLDLLQGTVYLIPAANPSALLDNRRVSSLDYKDLNRVGCGSKEGTATERIGALLFEFLSKFDLVINLHEFEMKTPITGVYMNAGSMNVKQKTLNAITAFNPEMIWVINSYNDQDGTYLLTLDTALADKGVVNFPIETTQLAFLTDGEIEKTVQGILNVIAFMGIITSSNSPRIYTQANCAFTRYQLTANEAGLWEPLPFLSLLKPVEKDTRIGTIKAFPDFREIPVLAPSSGTLIQYRHRQKVETGTSLFSIGQPADHLIAEPIAMVLSL